MRAGDLFLSFGASWPITGHAEATAHLRDSGIKVIRMIYDLIPTMQPQWSEESNVRQTTAWIQQMLTHSDQILTISEFSRSEIETYSAEIDLPPPPLSVVRLGDELQSADDTPLPLPQFIPERPFFVCVSALDLRKNHRLLYDAWKVLVQRHPDGCPDLVCLGVPHRFIRELIREIRHDRRVSPRIHILQNIKDTELAWYYNKCVATIYPSRYEGWGLPVAESLSRGRLCLASNATSIPEISADLPAFFDPLDVYGLVGLVERAASDPDWVRDRESAIRSRFRPTSWSQTAEEVLRAVGWPGESVGQAAA